MCIPLKNQVLVSGLHDGSNRDDSAGLGGADDDDDDDDCKDDGDDGPSNGNHSCNSVW